MEFCIKKLFGFHNKNSSNNKGSFHLSELADQTGWPARKLSVLV